MSVHSFQVTIGAGANTQVQTRSQIVNQVMFQNNATHVMRVGGSEVTTSLGAQLNAAAGGNAGGSANAGPFSVQFGGTDLSQWYVAGTQNDVLDVTYIA